MKIRLPDWLRRDDVKLPPWAKFARDPNPKMATTIDVDSAAAYAEWLQTLAPEKVDQYWLEVAFQCIKLDVQAAIAGTKYDPRVAGKMVEIKFSRAEAYALEKFPRGRGTEVATKGLEARGHYVRIRGAMPM